MNRALNPRDRAKQAAAMHVVDNFIVDGMTLGLGSGSTAEAFLRALGERIRAGLHISGVPTSRTTEELARQCSIPLVDFDDVIGLDLTIDGADEVDAEFCMIKGGGGCLTREKIVAQASREMIVLIDESKLVATIGAFALPIEVIPFGWRATQAHIRNTLGEYGLENITIMRRGSKRTPFITDNHNYILDCHLGRIDHAALLTSALNTIPGVIENGLFVSEATSIVIGRADGSAHRLTKPLSEL